MALSQAESQYNVRKKFAFFQRFSAVHKLCPDQVHVFESVNPMCLMMSLSVSIVLFMRNGECCWGSDLLENSINNALNFLY